MRELIALGGAEGVWSDFDKARQLCPGADVGAVNDSGTCYPGRLAIWVTLHPEKFARWQGFRQRRGLNTDYVAVSRKNHPGARVDRVRQQVFPGCSGLYLCQIAALDLGYDRIVLCGMPATETPHFFDSTPWPVAGRYQRWWLEASQQPELRGKIRSMSGWTRQLLGCPDKNWLAVPVS